MPYKIIQTSSHKVKLGKSLVSDTINFIKYKYMLATGRLLFNNAHFYKTTNSSKKKFSYNLNFQFINRCKIGHFAILSDNYSDFNQEVIWNVCPNSKYRWKKTWHKLSNKERPENSDIKVPWELGRLQFLLPILLYSIANDDDVTLKYIYKTLIDFHTKNPVGMGVQWGCNMDVAIRAVNLVMLYNIGLHYRDNENIRSILDLIINVVPYYLKHIEQHLEWNNGERNNHYLCNLLGMISISSLLYDQSNNDDKYMNILKDYLGKFETEIKHQFNDDGSNFECSVNYHRLSTEVVVISYLFFNKYFDKELLGISQVISKALDFMNEINFNSRLPDIGDTDSGYILCITPVFKLNNKGEVVLDYSKVSLFNEMNNLSLDIDKFIYESILGKDYTSNEATECDFLKVSDELYKCSMSNSMLKVSIDEPAKWYLKVYEDFGLYIFKSSIGYMLVKLNGINNSGHKHVDFIKCELCINGVYLSKFPGTKSYSLSHESRMANRSVNKGVKVTSSYKSKFSKLVFNEEYFDSHVIEKERVIFRCGRDKLVVRFLDDGITFDYDETPFIKPEGLYLSYGVKANTIKSENIPKITPIES